MDPTPTPEFATSETWKEELAALRRFIRALKRPDQVVMQELLDETLALFSADDPEIEPLSSVILAMQVVLWRKIRGLVI